MSCIPIRNKDLVRFLKEEFDVSFSVLRLKRWINLKYFSPESPAKGKWAEYSFADLVVAAFISESVGSVEMETIRALSENIRHMISDPDPEETPVEESLLVFSKVKLRSNVWRATFVTWADKELTLKLEQLDERLMILPIGFYYKKAAEFLNAFFSEDL